MSTPIKNTASDGNIINTIIFDLGKVIVDIDFEKSKSSFKRMSNIPHHVIDQFFCHQDFQLFERGEISAQDFFLRVKKLFSIESDISEIAAAWNEMIIGVPLESISLLRKLKHKFTLYALSNTNCSHIEVINDYLLTHYRIENLAELFNKVYYSYELKLAKPDQKIFEYVIKDAKISPKQTLFIDDNYENIAVSKNLGFNTIHLINQKELGAVFNSLG